MAPAKLKCRTHLPARRPLRIYASDPMLAHTPGNRIVVDVPNEPLEEGPVGARLEVIDYDGEKNCFYSPVNLDDPAILMQNGLEPYEADPRFHQQMVYAVAMRTLENFDQARGRLEFLGHNLRIQRLRLFPHAFVGPNAYFDPDLNAILFGYFRADREDPGQNLPGQTVFTCLSHDIIVHEFTHAVIHRLRRHFLEPTNPDVLAFHEGFADIVALLQHFTFEEILKDQIQKTHVDIRAGEILVGLARQFGYATGSHKVLRSAIGSPSLRLSPTVTEVHERGSILVAAVFDAFFAIYERRIHDLLRIATGGTSILPAGDLHPDLVNRLAHEAAHTAKSVLNMCIRAFDYLPPVDITFGDFLRALVTTDFEMEPADELNYRGTMIEGFRARGIYPMNVTSLAEESLIWHEAPEDLPSLDPERLQFANNIYLAAASFSLDPLRKITKSGQAQPGWGSISSTGEFSKKKSILAIGLHEYARMNAEKLFLDINRDIAVSGFQPVFRVSTKGQIKSGLVVQFSQHDDEKKGELGGIPFRGGTTIFATIDGDIRYMIAKPLPSKSLPADVNEMANLRLSTHKAYLKTSDQSDLQMTFGDNAYMQHRSQLRMKLRSLHEGVVV